jgi:hypothetical protein
MHAMPPEVGNVIENLLVSLIFGNATNHVFDT